MDVTTVKALPPGQHHPMHATLQPYWLSYHHHTKTWKAAGQSPYHFENCPMSPGYSKGHSSKVSGLMSTSKSSLTFLKRCARACSPR